MKTNLLDTLKVTGQIASGEGHKDFVGTLKEAIAEIKKQCQEYGMWVIANGVPLFPTTFNSAEENQLIELLASAENPNFVLTHPLAGGSN